MLTFQEPGTGRTQQVGENEHQRIATLKRLGWKQVAPLEAAEATVTVVQELEPHEVGDAVLAVTEIPVEGAEDVTVELPVPDGEADEKPADKSKKG